VTRTERTAEPAAATSAAMNWYVIGRGNSCPCRLNASAVASASPTPIDSRRASPSAADASTIENRSRRPEVSPGVAATPMMVTGTMSVVSALVMTARPFQR
jgi:hypothetical protein